MPTTFYLQDGGGGVSGYDAACPQRGSAAATATVDTAASGTDIQWTKSAGGAALSFVTRPLSAAVTISGTITVNMWARESHASANAGARMKVYKLTAAGAKTLIATLSKGTELGTSLAAQNFTGTPTSTAFAVGDRIVFEPYLTNVGTMGGNRTADFAYSGGTAAASGDSYVTLNETVQVRAIALTT